MASLLILLTLAGWRYKERTAWAHYAVILSFGFSLLPVTRAQSAEVLLVRDDETRPARFAGGGMQEEDLSSDEDPPDARWEEEPFPSYRDEADGSDEQHALFPEQEPPFPPTAVEPAPGTELPVPSAAPPFLSRPSEWEATPPTVIGAPPLPAASSFSGRALAAFQFVELGKESFDQEHWEQAEAQLERAVSLAPFLPYSYYFLGRIAFAHRDHKRALAFLQKAELLFPHTERAWLGETDRMKGLVYEDVNDYPHARIAYRKSLRFQPANLTVLSALARLPEEGLSSSNPRVQ